MFAAKTESTAPVRLRKLGHVPVIGWREWLALPAFQIDRVKAKIDTGARTSSIHAFDVRTLTDRGAPHVSFLVCPEQRLRLPAIPCIAEIRDERTVKSSSGHRQRRYVIRVEVRMGDIAWPIELTLADRDAMGFRMLLGREAIRNRFLIDSSRSFIAGRRYADVTEIANRKGRRK